MVKAVGIDIGDYAVKAVELDGSYRKTRLLRHRIESSPAGEGDAAVRSELVAETVLRTLTEGKIGRGDLRLGYPSREAVLRTVEVPFSGDDAIRKVIKSEVEGAIHSQSVDDMVVDFHIVGKTTEGTRVLVAAVPKPGLRSLLDALEEVGLEPENIDLDTMALYRVADWCGVFARPELEAAAPAEVPLPLAVGAPVRVAVLDVGSRATRVLLVEDGRLVEMRVLRVGDAAIAEDIAKRHGLPAPLARQAVVACLSTGTDFRADVAEQLPVPAEGAAETPAAAPSRSTLVTHAEVEAAQTGWLQRLSRELVRFLVSVGERGKVQDLFVTGGASTTAGMQELLREVFAVEPRPLDVVGHLQHDLPPEEAAAIGPHIAIAVGLALAPFGGPEGFQLRQEDLAYARGFDRVKFPLAIFCMVAIFGGLVWIVKLNNDLKGQELILGRNYDDHDERGKERHTFFGMVFTLLSDKSWFKDDRYFDSKSYSKLFEDVRNAPVPERVRLIRNRLAELAKNKQRESGQFEDLTLESGLAVLVRFAEVMKSKEPELGRFLIHEVNLTLGTGQSRTLEFTVSFRSDATAPFRVRSNTLKAAIEAEIARPDSPCFKKLVEAKEDRFSDSDTSGVEGAYYKVRIELRDTIPPFGGTK